FGQAQAVNDAIRGIDAVQFGNLPRGFGKNAGRVEGAAGRQGFEGFDVGLEDADIALGEARRGAAALLQFLLAGGGARIDEDIANAQLLDEAQGFFAGAGADGEHPDHRAHTEDDTEGGEQGASFLGAEIGGRLPDIGEDDHRDNAFIALFGWLADLCIWSGLDMETKVFSWIPVITA